MVKRRRATIAEGVVVALLATLTGLYAAVVVAAPFALIWWLIGAPGAF